MPRGKLSTKARLYVWCVITAGGGVITASAHDIVASPLGHQWLILAALTIVSGSATVKLPSVPASLTVSETFVFTSVLLFGPAAGTLTVALDGLISSLWLWVRKEHRVPHRLLFNVAAPAVSIWSSSQLFFLLADMQPLVEHPAGLSQFLVPLAIFTVLYFLLNSWLIAGAVALETSQSPAHIWRQNFLWLSLNFLCGASVAALLTLYFRTDSATLNLSFLTYLGAVLPLLFVLYLTYRTSMGRVEDANRHLAQINQMYLSTIETLAMAVDAKDQVTHGHIRRVQLYATSLARELGIRDQGLLKAIEASALLHDMGKLAIPEHILNKPGKLTNAEFDKMKLHAAIGADILSAIEFPYPVVPIVRHHHENWDGTGYPDGLIGTDIPIGARILAVVDCYDALTSDRPYRPRLPDRQAVSILFERRGTMYDPLIVDTFVRVHATLSIDHLTDPPLPHSMVANFRTAYEHYNSSFRSGGPTGEQRLLESGAPLTDGDICSLRPIVETACLEVSCLAGASEYVLAVYNSSRDDLVVRAVSSEVTAVLLNQRIPLGQRSLGWVGANKRLIVNSDAALDLGPSARSQQDRLKHALVLPLCEDEALIGVLGLYSCHRFGDEAQSRALASTDRVTRLISARTFLRRLAAS